MTLRILHAADLHLDSPLQGVALPESLPRDLLCKAPRLAFERLIDHAISHKVHLVLIAGDVFDDEGNDAQTILWLRDRLRLLAKEGIEVAMLHGNHDHAALGANFVQWPDNVFVFPKDAPSTRTYQLDGRTVCVHGQSFPSRHTRDNLTHRYPAAVPGAFNVGLLHTSLNGSLGHDPYAPCTILDLERMGYDYWALGHVHKRQSWPQSRGGWISYSGNLQGRDMGESGPKGFLWLEIDAGPWEPAFVPSDVLRFRRETIDLSGCDTPDDFEERIRRHPALREPAPAPELVRLRLTGRTPLHPWMEQRPRERDELARCALEASGRHRESIVVTTEPQRSFEEIRATDDLRSAVLAAVDELKGDRQTVDSAWKAAHDEITRHLANWLDDDLKIAQVTDELWSEVLCQILGNLEEVH